MNDLYTKHHAQSEILHRLPMTALEQALKNAYLQRPDIHGRILTADEIKCYYTWMAANFDASVAFQEPIIMDSDVGQLGRHLLQNPKDVTSLTQLTSMYEKSPESGFFAADQDITICRPLRYMPPYWHTSDYFEVYYIFRGNCPVHTSRETVTLRPGDVFITPPFTKTATSYTYDDVVLLDIMIRASTFRHVFLEQLAPSNLMTMFFNKALSGGENDNYLLFHTRMDAILEQLLVSIYHASAEKNPYSMRMRNPLMSTFFLYLLKQYEQTVQVSSHSTIRRKPEYAEILIFIQTHYRTVTLEKVSQKFGYSQRQIIRIIQSSTGKTFSALLSQLRMEKAAALLKRGNMTIETIAAELGYCSLSGFYHAFTKYYGHAPGLWSELQINTTDEKP